MKEYKKILTAVSIASAMLISSLTVFAEDPAEITEPVPEISLEQTETTEPTEETSEPVTEVTAEPTEPPASTMPAITTAKPQKIINIRLEPEKIPHWSSGDFTYEFPLYEYREDLGEFKDIYRRDKAVDKKNYTMKKGQNKDKKDIMTFRFKETYLRSIEENNAYFDVEFENFRLNDSMAVDFTAEAVTTAAAVTTIAAATTTTTTTTTTAASTTTAKTTTKAKTTTTTKKKTPSPKTGDSGISAVLGLFTMAAAGIYLTKKNK